MQKYYPYNNLLNNLLFCVIKTLLSFATKSIGPKSSPKHKFWAHKHSLIAQLKRSPFLCDFMESRARTLAILNLNFGTSLTVLYPTTVWSFNVEKAARLRAQVYAIGKDMSLNELA